MSSFLHEGLVTLLREQPRMLFDLVRSVHGLAIDARSLARLDATDLTSLDPAERRADLVLLCTDADGAPSYGLVVEVQLGPDPDKAYRWPAYAVVLRDRHRCPVDVLVVCVDAALARSFAAPIALGHSGSTFRPLVLGPDAVPLITDVERARHEPELAVLSALAHRTDKAGVDAAFAAVSAAGGLDDRWRGVYIDMVLGALGKAARQAVEARMTSGGYEYQTEFARTHVAKGRAEGEVKGKAEALLAVLEVRGLAITAEQRARIVECTDLAQLDVWVRRAVTVGATSRLFAPTKRAKRAAERKPGEPG